MLFQRMLSTFARPFTQEVAAAGRPALRSLAEFAAVYRDHGLSVQELSTVVTVLTTLEVRGTPVALAAAGSYGDSLPVMTTTSLNRRIAWPLEAVHAERDICTSV